MPRPERHRGKRAEVIRHAWLEYHAGRITHDELARVLAGVGRYDIPRLNTCQPPQGERPDPS